MGAEPGGGGSEEGGAKNERTRAGPGARSEATEVERRDWKGKARQTEKREGRSKDDGEE